MCIRDRYQRRVRGVPFSMSSGLSPDPVAVEICRLRASHRYRDVQEGMVVLTPQEQRRADSQQRIDELRSQLAARHSQLDPEQSGPVSEQEVATKHRLRAIADVHGLSKSASFIEQTTPKESGDQPAPVATMSSICPAVYSDSAQRRIMELRKAQHEMNLAPHHSMKWSDMDR
eukprot:TRINITY_DN6857_c0_g1_i1.p1 TRINITY_DN6857_c0_g1~~TRINITY_DN6857_c0_g1_i1.p1  ORF type:complete len:173 (+),score=40.76 TRINITY_DN6857_c0_g1_i1:95-613(+)